MSVMIELRRMDGKTWVALEDGLCVVPVALVDEFVRDWKEWRREFAVAVEIPEAGSREWESRVGIWVEGGGRIMK